MYRISCPTTHRPPGLGISPLIGPFRRNLRKEAGLEAPGKPPSSAEPRRRSCAESAARLPWWCGSWRPEARLASLADRARDRASDPRRVRRGLVGCWRPTLRSRAPGNKEPCAECGEVCGALRLWTSTGSALLLVTRARRGTAALVARPDLASSPPESGRPVVTRVFAPPAPRTEANVVGLLRRAGRGRAVWCAAESTVMLGCRWMMTERFHRDRRRPPVQRKRDESLAS